MAEPKAQQIQSSQVAHRPLNQGQVPSHMTPLFLSLSLIHTLACDDLSDPNPERRFLTVNTEVARWLPFRATL